MTLDTTKAINYEQLISNQTTIKNSNFEHYQSKKQLKNAIAIDSSILSKTQLDILDTISNCFTFDICKLNKRYIAITKYFASKAKSQQWQYCVFDFDTKLTYVFDSIAMAKNTIIDTVNAEKLQAEKLQADKSKQSK
jgi:hypothetical protein